MSRIWRGEKSLKNKIFNLLKKRLFEAMHTTLLDQVLQPCQVISSWDGCDKVSVLSTHLVGYNH